MEEFNFSSVNESKEQRREFVNMVVNNLRKKLLSEHIDIISCQFSFSRPAVEIGAEMWERAFAPGRDQYIEIKIQTRDKI